MASASFPPRLLRVPLDDGEDVFDVIRRSCRAAVACEGGPIAVRVCDYGAIAAFVDKHCFAESEDKKDDGDEAERNSGSGSTTTLHENLRKDEGAVFPLKFDGIHAEVDCSRRHHLDRTHASRLTPHPTRVVCLDG